MTRSRDSESRRQAYGLGLRAEWAAVAILVLKGYRVLARRYTAPGGEIDLVALRGDTVAFVEVKARSTLDQARMSITPAKERRVAIAARHWLARNRWAASRNLRADAIFVAGFSWPEHITAAFELEL
jgi:putative endonuclease